jgi:hypothetical protein
MMLINLIDSETKKALKERARVNKNARDWRAANPEHFKEIQKRYYEKRGAQRMREWRAANPDKVKEIDARAYANGGKERARKRRDENREKYNDYARRYAHTLGARDHKLQVKYGISLKQYDEMLESQHGVCAGCNGMQAVGAALYVDHDHQTGKVRGLLCHHCNVVLGYSRDSVEVLRKLADYLERSV